MKKQKPRAHAREIRLVNTSYICSAPKGRNNKKGQGESRARAESQVAIPNFLCERNVDEME